MITVLCLVFLAYQNHLDYLKDGTMLLSLAFLVTLDCISMTLASKK